MDFSDLGKPQRAGLIVFGLDYAALSVYRDGGGKTQLELSVCRGADRERPEKLVTQLAIDGEVVWLRVAVAEPGMCHFSFSTDGETFTPIGGASRLSRVNGWGRRLGCSAWRLRRAGRPGMRTSSSFGSSSAVIRARQGFCARAGGPQFVVQNLLILHQTANGIVGKSWIGRCGDVAIRVEFARVSRCFRPVRRAEHEGEFDGIAGWGIRVSPQRYRGHGESIADLRLMICI
jgi:hypothetical protein